jgi:MFS family permease
MSEPPPKIAYEQPDPERAASAAPTENELETQVPGGREAGRVDPYSAWRFRDYRLYAIGFWVSTIAAQMANFAALYEVYRKTGSPLSLGWVGLALAIPMLVLTLPAGQFADTHSRRLIVLGTQIICGLSAVGLALLSMYGANWIHSVSAMYLLLGLGAVGSVASRPARNALMPQLVPTGVFPNAVTWNATIFESATVIGPAIGGFICAVSIPAAYITAAVGFCICAALTGLLPEVQVRKTGASAGKASIVADLAIGLRFVWRTRLMLGAMTLDLFAVLLGGATFLLPAFAKEILDVGPIGLSWLRAAPSIGAISMAVLQAHRPPIQRAGRALLIAVTGFGVATIVFGMSRNYWLSLFMLLLTGAFDNISVVVRHTLIQLLTPDEMRGRVSAVNQVFIGSSNEIGGLESGLTGAWLGPVRSVVYGGIGTLVVVVMAILSFPELRRLGSLADIRPKPIDTLEAPGLAVVETSGPADRR